MGAYNWFQKCHVTDMSGVLNRYLYFLLLSRMSLVGGDPMRRGTEFLSDPQWEKILPLFWRFLARKVCPRADDRMVMERILWVLRTGARWKV